MIDRRRRNQMAGLLRHFAAGRLTNDEYEERFDEIDNGTRADPALFAIHQQVWHLYSDLHTHRLSGKWALRCARRREVARWILFLYSDYEYEWPLTFPYDFWYLLLNLVTLGWWAQVGGNHWRRRLGAYSDWEVWPFSRRADFEEARRQTRLFGGAAA